MPIGGGGDQYWVAAAAAAKMDREKREETGEGDAGERIPAGDMFVF
jgi:hypothetical protein